jgi:hypothetical protein
MTASMTPVQARRVAECEGAGLLARLERVSLLLLFFGTAFCSMLYYVIGSSLEWLPDWVYTRYPLCVAIPACLFGCFAYCKHRGFARSLPMAAVVLLLAASTLWTEESELGRGLLKVALFAVTLPVAALVVKHNYVPACQKAFVLGTGILFLAAVTDPAAHMFESRFGYLKDASSQVVSNPNIVGLQAALAAIITTIWALYPERRAPRGGGGRLRLLVGPLSAAFFCYLVLRSGSRTAFLTLSGVMIWIFLKRFRSSPVAIVTVLLLCLILAASLLAFDIALDSGNSHAFEAVNARLFQDAEENVSTLGNRTLIWSCAWDRIRQEERWVAGFGSGGVDKQLGRCFDRGTFRLGGDGIKRLHSHNTFVEWALMCGALGLAVAGWLAIRAAITARRLDAADGGCGRTSLLLYILLLSFGSVINTIAFWLAVGPLVWAMLTPDSLRSGRYPRQAFRLVADAAGQPLLLRDVTCR